MKSLVFPCLLVCAAILSLRGDLQRGVPAPPSPPSPALPPRVLFSGCQAVLTGPVCMLAPGAELRVWVEGDRASSARIRVDLGDLDAAPPVVVPPGVRFTVKVPAEARELWVEGVGARWTLRLAPLRPIDVIEEARALNRKGSVEEGEKVLVRALATVPPDVRPRVLGVLARTELALGRPEEAFARFREAIAGDRGAGMLSEEIDARCAFAFALSEQKRFADARAALADRPADEESYPDGVARRPYYEGQIAAAAGDLRSALSRFAVARAAADKLGLVRVRRNADQERALLLVDMGLGEEALEVLMALDREDSSGVPVCDRGDLLTNLGWTALSLRAQDPRPGRADPAAPLRAALHLYETDCPEPRRRANVLVDLAFVALQDDDARAARARVDEARAAGPEMDFELARDLLEVEGRIAMHEGDPRRALASFQEEVRIAAGSSWAWSARLGKGEALEALGRDHDARAEYEVAERLVDAQSVDVPTKGRDSFLGGRERSARLLVDLLVREGDARAALRVVRVARSRVLARLRRGDRVAGLEPSARVRWEDALSRYRAAREALDVEAADDWRLSARALAVSRAARTTRDASLRAELDEAFAMLSALAPVAAPSDAPPPSGALDVAFFPVAGAWVVLASSAAGVEVHVVREAGFDGASLFASIHGPLAAADRVRILAYGPARGVDLHAFTFEGEPLLAHAPVEYGLDLDVPLAVSDARPREAAVITDPSGNLRFAQEEGAAVTRALTSRDFRVGLLEGEQATGAKVREALTRVDWVHYGGHSAFVGESGWDAALLLANGSQLTVADVLALPKVPSFVVLSGCEAARASVDVAPEGLGLAQAFLVAGARQVVAATRVVDDALAAALMRALYGALSADPARDLPAALRAAQLAVRKATPDADWAAFRVLTP